MERPLEHGPTPKRVPHTAPTPVRVLPAFNVSYHHLDHGVPGPVKQSFVMFCLLHVVVGVATF